MRFVLVPLVTLAAAALTACGPAEPLEDAVVVSVDLDQDSPGCPDTHWRTHVQMLDGGHTLMACGKGPRPGTLVHGVVLSDDSRARFEIR